MAWAQGIPNDPERRWPPPGARCQNSVVAEAVPTRRRDEDGKLLYELELGKGDVSGSVSPRVSELVGNAAVGKPAEPLSGNGGSGNVSAQPFHSFSIPAPNHHSRVQAETLNARALLPDPRLHILDLDAIGHFYLGENRTSLLWADNVGPK